MSGKHLAIVIGVSKYDHEENLDGCQADFDVMKEIVAANDRFSDETCLYLDDDTSSSNIKSSLADFIELHRHSDVSEVFFYFSGHGYFDDDDFYFVCTDFHKNRLHTTTLSNSELDQMLRSLNPAIAAKIVDACHSAVAYVKDSDALTSVVQETKKHFSECYFMFSSQRDQVSYQDEGALSDFTRVIVKSIADHSGTSIRYKDIMSYVTDWFDQHQSKQTPVFVFQGPCTQRFCLLTEALREILYDSLGVSSEDSSESSSELSGAPNKDSLQPEQELLQRVKDASSHCSTKEDALKVLRHIEGLCVQAKPSEMIKAMYSLTIDVKETQWVPNKQAIGKWFESTSDEYFVEMEYEEESYRTHERVRIPQTGMMRLAPLMFPEYEMKEVTKTRQKLVGANSTVEQPFYNIQFTYEPRPNYKSAPWWDAYIVAYLSQTDVRFFYAIIRQRNVNWDKRVNAEPVMWGDIVESCVLE